MADESEIKVKLSAVTQGLTDGLSQASGQIKGFAGGIQGAFNGLGGAVSSIQGPLMALGGVLAGGAMFKSAIDATVKWNGEAIKMARTLNITTEQASILNVALGDIYTDTETYLGAAQKLTRQLATGGEGFKKLGIDTKDANGKLKETVPLMQETLEKLNKIEAGTQRNAAGTALFGRGWGEASKLMKLNNQVMEEAREKAEKLNLIVGGDAVEAQKKYKAAQNDMEDGLLGIKLTIGQELLPVLTDLMTMFGDVLTPVVTVLGYAVKGLVTAWETLKFVIKAVANVVGAVFGSIMDAAGHIGSAISNLLHGRFKEAADDAKKAAGAIENNFSAAAQNIGEDYDKLGEKMAKIWDRSAKGGATKVNKEGGESFDPGKQTGMKQWEAEIAAMRSRVLTATHGFNQLSEQAELEFWAGKLSKARAGTEEYTKVVEKMNALEQKIGEEKIKEYQEEEDKFWQLRQLGAEDTANKAMSDLELRRAYFEQRLALGQVSGAQELEQRRKFAEEELQIQIKQLEIEQDAAGDDQVKKQAIQNKINALNRKGALDISKLNIDAATKTSKAWTDAAARMGDAFGKAIGGIINHTMTFKQAMSSILKAALAELLKYVLKTITAKGAEAGAGAAASAAQTPVVGWAMAIPAMAAVMAAVLGLGSGIGSAAGGWDIPAGVNPMGQLHAEEMVLPAKYANVIRDLADGDGGSGGKQMPPPQVNVQISAIDGHSVERFLRNNPDALASGIKNAHRDYYLRRS